MRLFPTTGADDFKTCSACRQTVARDDCHKNRYQEYICKSCQRRGVRFTWRNRLRQVGKRTLLLTMFGSLGAGLVFLLLWIAYSLVLQLNLFKVLFG